MSSPGFDDGLDGNLRHATHHRRTCDHASDPGRLSPCPDPLVARRLVDRLHGRGPPDRPDPRAGLDLRHLPAPQEANDIAPFELPALGDPGFDECLGAPRRVDRTDHGSGLEPRWPGLGVRSGSHRPRQLQAVRGRHPRRLDSSAGGLVAPSDGDGCRGVAVALPGHRLEPRRAVSRGPAARTDGFVDHPGRQWPIGQRHRRRFPPFMGADGEPAGVLPPGRRPLAPLRRLGSGAAPPPDRRRPGEPGAGLDEGRAVGLRRRPEIEPQAGGLRHRTAGPGPGPGRHVRGGNRPDPVGRLRAQPRPTGRRGVDHVRPRRGKRALRHPGRRAAQPDRLVPPARQRRLQEVLAGRLHDPRRVAVDVARRADPGGAGGVAGPTLQPGPLRPRSIRPQITTGRPRRSGAVGVDRHADPFGSDHPRGPASGFRSTRDRTANPDRAAHDPADPDRIRPELRDRSEAPPDRQARATPLRPPPELTRPGSRHPSSVRRSPTVLRLPPGRLLRGPESPRRARTRGRNPRAPPRVVDDPGPDPPQPGAVHLRPKGHRVPRQGRPAGRSEGRVDRRSLPSQQRAAPRSRVAPLPRRVVDPAPKHPWANRSRSTRTSAWCPTGPIRCSAPNRRSRSPRSCPPRPTISRPLGAPARPGCSDPGPLPPNRRSDTHPKNFQRISNCGSQIAKPYGCTICDPQFEMCNKFLGSI